MGYFSELDIEFRSEVKNPYIADILGISYEELLTLEYRFYTDKGKNGLIYTYRIEFDKDSPKKILDKIDRLEDGYIAYIQPHELNVSDYYQYEFESIPKNEEHVHKFRLEIEGLKQLCQVEISKSEIQLILNRQICIGVFGAMETFLSEVFISLTLNNPEYFQNFVETHPEFKKRKFELRDIYREKRNLEETAKKIMLDTIYHNLPVVRMMYRETFQIEFPNIEQVNKYVLMRHDLVHRNGKSKNGEIINTDNVVIDELMECISTFVNDIAKELKLVNH